MLALAISRECFLLLVINEFHEWKTTNGAIYSPSVETLFISPNFY